MRKKVVFYIVSIVLFLVNYPTTYSYSNETLHDSTNGRDRKNRTRKTIPPNIGKYYIRRKSTKNINAIIGIARYGSVLINNNLPPASILVNMDGFTYELPHITKTSYKNNYSSKKSPIIPPIPN